MAQFNIQNTNPPATNYSLGLLPQRNQKGLWYNDTSCRANLTNLNLSSENRRVLKKTSNFSFVTQALPCRPPKTIFNWVKKLEWDFPANSIKTVFTNHIFNRFYVWFDQNKIPCAYSVCYFSPSISHIAYVFYNPTYSHSNLPIRLVLQAISDSYQEKLNFCYLGRDHTNGFYKRNMPGYEYFNNGKWIQYK